MFTGIVEGLGEVLRVEPLGGTEGAAHGAATGRRLTLRAPTSGPAPGGGEAWSVGLGDSVSVSGCCLTVVSFAGGELVFDLSKETLDRTHFGALEVGRRLNLERALRLSDRLGGHLVSGHVDGVGRVVGARDVGDGGRVIRFEAPAGFERWLFDKGSVCLDGVSLTVVEPAGREFDVAVIPVTLRETTLGSARAGDPVHFEGDLIGKWVARLVPPRP